MFSRFGTPTVGEASLFSFNHVEGMCPQCEGLGNVTAVDADALLDRSKSLNQGAIRLEPFAPGSARWKRYAWSGYFDNDKKLDDYTPEEWELLLNALQQMAGVGLGYLSLDRETSTLSGGESQRVKMVRHLGSSLCDLTYAIVAPLSDARRSLRRHACARTA